MEAFQDNSTSGVGVAFGEELGAPVLSTPAAIATVATGNFVGTYIAENGAKLTWNTVSG